MPIYTIKLLDRQTIARNTLLLTFEKPEGFTYQAGQYGGFTLINPAATDAKGNNRRFSFLSSPADPHLSLATRIQTSAYKHNLQTMPLGQTLKLAGPSGQFILHEDASIPAVFIAGGIGIAPFYSMLRDTLIHRPQQQVVLFYGNQTLTDAALHEEILALAHEHVQLKVVPVLATPEADWKGEQGFITDALLVKYVPDLELPIFYTCGSPGMVAAMREMLRELGITEDRIKYEDFPGY